MHAPIWYPLRERLGRSYDQIDVTQYTEAELRAAVEAAETVHGHHL